MTVLEALNASLGALDLRPEDQAAQTLARRYAELLDADPTAVGKTGPQFLAVLESLGMTPRARAAVVPKGGDSSDGRPGNRADELRQRRAARQHPATAVD